MPDKTKNPFVVEIESADSVDISEPKKVKEVIKPPEPKVESPTVQAVIKKIEKVITTPPKKKKPQWEMFFAGVATTLLLVAVGGGGWWMWNSQIGRETVRQVVAPKPTQIVNATPKPTPESVVVDRSLIVVEVLNASGVKGKASEVASQIQALGYKKGTTGNTASQTGSTLSLSEDVATLSATILAEIGEIVPGVTMTTTPLTGSNAMRLILGTE